MKASFFQLITGAAIAGTLGSGVFTPAHSFQFYSLNLAPELLINPTATGSGSGTLTYDDMARTLAITVSFSGLSGTSTRAHIHSPTTSAGIGNAGLATTFPTFDGFPAGVTSGSFNTTLDLTSASSYNEPFITANGGIAGAEAALISSFNAGTAYFDIHTTTITSGEIRGFVTAVPEPLTILGAATAVGFGAKFKRHLAQSQKGKKDVG
jgi:hypothetical protein